MESLGEAMALIGKGGVDKRQYLEILTSTLFGAPVYKTYGALLADGSFEPAGFATLGLKDIRLALAAAEELRVPHRKPCARPLYRPARERRRGAGLVGHRRSHHFGSRGRQSRRM
jgi:3-hydroxyisobutyrate dehydrogenase-like beta-hydroxyacid dehydrogenase